MRLLARSPPREQRSRRRPEDGREEEAGRGGWPMPGGLDDVRPERADKGRDRADSSQSNVEVARAASAGDAAVAARVDHPGRHGDQQRPVVDFDQVKRNLRVPRPPRSEQRPQPRADRRKVRSEPQLAQLCASVRQYVSTNRFHIGDRPASKFDVEVPATVSLTPARPHSKSSTPSSASRHAIRRLIDATSRPSMSAAFRKLPASDAAITKVRSLISTACHRLKEGENATFSVTRSGPGSLSRGTVLVTEPESGSIVGRYAQRCGRFDQRVVTSLGQAGNFAFKSPNASEQFL